MTRSLFSIFAALALAATPAALADTGDTSDSGEETETGDTGYVDTGSLQEAYSLSERTGEEGGCGLGSKALLLLPVAGLLARRRRA